MRRGWLSEFVERTQERNCLLKSVAVGLPVKDFIVNTVQFTHVIASEPELRFEFKRGTGGTALQLMEGCRRGSRLKALPELFETGEFSAVLLGCLLHAGHPRDRPGWAVRIPEHQEISQSIRVALQVGGRDRHCFAEAGIELLRVLGIGTLVGLLACRRRVKGLFGVRSKLLPPRLDRAIVLLLRGQRATRLS